MKSKIEQLRDEFGNNNEILLDEEILELYKGSFISHTIDLQIASYLLIYKYIKLDTDIINNKLVTSK